MSENAVIFPDARMFPITCSFSVGSSVPIPTDAPTPVTRIPDRAVTIPIESMLITSSYVSVPAILTLPLNVPVVPLILF